MRSGSWTAVAAFFCALSTPVAAHDAEEGVGRLGKVDFANSCDAQVQKELQRAVAMLHSFWYSAGEKAFRHVLADDPSCAVATWGIAALLMNNPLAGQGASPQAAGAAMAGIMESRNGSATAVPMPRRKARLGRALRVKIMAGIPLFAIEMANYERFRKPNSGSRNSWPPVSDRSHRPSAGRRNPVPGPANK